MSVNGLCVNKLLRKPFEEGREIWCERKIITYVCCSKTISVFKFKLKR